MLLNYIIQLENKLYYIIKLENKFQINAKNVDIFLRVKIRLLTIVVRVPQFIKILNLSIVLLIIFSINFIPNFVLNKTKTFKTEQTRVIGGYIKYYT